MATRPTLTTERLVLRPFTLDDAKDVQRLAGAAEVASTTLLIPHPYPDGVAEEWIATHERRFDERQELVLAITLAASAELVGSVGLIFAKPEQRRAELGYWLGVPYWNQGYCTEAARALLSWGFGEYGLERVFASIYTRNPASGRVLEKLGMTREGTLRQHIVKNGVREDVGYYGILASEFRLI